MWTRVLPGFHETFYDYAFWFLIYSVMGWIVESIYISFCNKKLTNRGYIHGPMCPIYGFGGTLVHMMLTQLPRNYFALFFLGSAFATTIEFITAMVMIKCFGCVWWDYTNKPFNYKGVICLESSVVWGLYSIMDVAFLKDLIFVVIHKIPYTVGKVVLITAFVYYTIDFIVSTIHNRRSGIGTEENNIRQYKF